MGYFAKRDQRTEEQIAADLAERQRHADFEAAHRCDKSELALFYTWWQRDQFRCECTLAQATDAYLKTFPGRTHSLLTELIERAHDQPIA